MLFCLSLYNRDVKYTKTLFFVGILIIAMPFLGLPIFWKNVGTVLLGLWVAGLSAWAFIEFLSDGGNSSPGQRKSQSMKGKKISVKSVKKEI